MYRSINSNALQRSMTFDLTDGINNNFIAGDGMTERHVGSPGEGAPLDDNDNSRHAFHPPVLVFSRPMLAQCTFRPLDADNFQEYNKELVDILSADNADCRVRHSDDMGINFHNNKINSFRSKRSATAPNSPGPYCKKDNQHLWKSFSAAPSRKNSIHYETLESVTVAELYNVAEDADQSNEDTPHASGHTTPNDNAAEDTPPVVEPASPRDGPVTEDPSLLRSRTESVSFVKLFNRIRLERDASFESISSDGQSDPKVLDQDMVDNSVYDREFGLIHSLFESFESSFSLISYTEKHKNTSHKAFFLCLLPFQP